MLGTRGFRFGDHFGFGGFGLWNICIDLSCQHSVFQIPKHLGFQISYQGGSTCTPRFNPVPWCLSKKGAGNTLHPLLPHFFIFLSEQCLNTHDYLWSGLLYFPSKLLATTWWLGFWWICWRETLLSRSKILLLKLWWFMQVEFLIRLKKIQHDFIKNAFHLIYFKEFSYCHNDSDRVNILRTF